MTTHSLLRWLERGLVAVGVVLALWCAAVIVEARFYQTAPVRAASGKLKVTQTLILPGDKGVKQSTRAPSAGMLICRLEAPSVKMSTAVLEGTDDATLKKGAGHIEETSLPGAGGNVGIAGHRDTVFRPLRHIKVGDPLDLTTADRLYRYRISKTHIVEPADVYVLDPTKTPTLTLVTCYPFDFIGNAPRRFIVRAELVKEEARATR